MSNLSLLKKLKFYFGGALRQDNVAWHSDIPTPFVVYCFRNGFIKKGNKVIDIGCGFGRNANWLSTQGVTVTAINTDGTELAEAKGKAGQLEAPPTYILADFLKSDIKDKFDVALDLGCSHMLSKADQINFEEVVARIIKPGGLLIYFGFSKNHPAYDANNKRAIYRSLDDVLAIYGNNFNLLSQNECHWKTKPEENSNYPEHVGLNIIMRRKL
jgi:SAM-dependent methyltransferase